MPSPSIRNTGNTGIPYTEWPPIQVHADGAYAYERSLTERVKFNHRVFGLAVTAFIW